MSSVFSDLQELEEDLTHQRAKTGILAKFLNWALPPDPRAQYVWPELAHEVVSNRWRLWRFVLIAALLLTETIGLIYSLLAVPGLNYSAVGLLTMLFELFVPRNWAVGLAWGLGLMAVLQLGSFIHHRPPQAVLDRRPASKSSFYDFWLRSALWEEMVFRAGAEKWTLSQQLRASLLFGIVHVVNIWVSLAAGLALSLTGFGFMLVYLWAYRRYGKSQIIATSVSATVHALYNTLVILVVVVSLLVGLGQWLLSLLQIRL